MSTRHFFAAQPLLALFELEDRLTPLIGLENATNVELSNAAVQNEFNRASLPGQAALAGRQNAAARAALGGSSTAGSLGGSDPLLAQLLLLSLLSSGGSLSDSEPASSGRRSSRTIGDTPTEASTATDESGLRPSRTISDTPTEATVAATEQTAAVVPTTFVAAAGPADGSYRYYRLAADGELEAAGDPAPGGVGGPARVLAADVTGDGIADTVVGSGPGSSARVRVVDGKIGEPVGGDLAPFGDFTGGVFVAAGDFDRDGRAEVVVTPDRGGGPRAVVYDFAPADGPRPLADFFAIDDPSFRGGARPAVGDLDGDGVPELVVAAGFLGGPRVAVWGGESVAAGRPARMVSDFFAFEPSVRNGAYVSVGDVSGDGVGDLVFGAGPGGGPRVLAADGRMLTAGGGAAAVADPLADFFAGDPSNRSGVRVSAETPADGDRAVVVTGDGGSGGRLRSYRVAPTGPELAADVSPFGSTLDGVFVG